MRATKYPLAVLASVVLIVGLLCSQICDINCAFYGCSLSSPMKAAEESSQPSHCHQHKQNPKPQERSHSRECPGHFDALILPSPSAASAYSLHHAADIEPPTIGPALWLNWRSISVVIPTDRLPDRSPPTYSVLRI
jgi:hypothetical protein